MPVKQFSKFGVFVKGIILAGGSGSRLWPITKGISKQLIPVYDKPLIHYPIGTLFLAGIKEILIITTPHEQDSFRRLLGDGSQYGACFTYAVQEAPKGLAQAFIIGENFIGDDNVALILGDNIFHGTGLGKQLQSLSVENGATIFAHKVSNPAQYGVVEFAKDGKAISLEEKPERPKSNFAIPGLYFYDKKVIEIAKQVLPSPRGELEITDINRVYLQMEKLHVQTLDRGTAWLDTGTIESLHAASSYIKIIEERQGSKICCLEEIAWRNAWISQDKLKEIATGYGVNPYGNYLMDLIQSNTILDD